MMIATVRGRFRDFEGTIVAAEDIAESRVAGKAIVASIDTGQADRDAHLRSPDFFDAGHFPEMSFRSTRIEHVEGGMFRIVGDLTISSIGDIGEIARERNIIVGVIAVPADTAQNAADALIDAGAKIIFNYSEALLDVPADVNVHTSNPAGDLLYALYFHLA